MQTVKAFIITEGGDKMGFGHITRCISLSQAFEDKGLAPEFVVYGDSSVRDLLGGRKHEVFNWLKKREKLFGILTGMAMSTKGSVAPLAGIIVLAGRG